MSIEAFLVIPPGSGNPPVDETPSTDSSLTAAFPNAAVIAVTGFEFAVENPTTIGAAAGGAGAGKMKLDQLLIHKPVDKVTASLFSASASGQHFAVIHLLLRRQAGTAQPVPFLVYEFQTVFITNIAWSGMSGDPDPAEAVTFAYGALRIAYKSTNSDGTLAPAVSSSWNQVTNTADIAGPSPLQ